jgi:hypothetical protein
MAIFWVIYFLIQAVSGGNFDTGFRFQAMVAFIRAIEMCRDDICDRATNLFAIRGAKYYTESRKTT